MLSRNLIFSRTIGINCGAARRYLQSACTLCSNGQIHSNQDFTEVVTTILYLSDRTESRYESLDSMVNISEGSEGIWL